MTTLEHSHAYSLGYKAYAAGLEENSCPYCLGDSRRWYWLRGWKSEQKK